jgi:hypothetical protein
MQRTEIGVVCVFEMAGHFVVMKAAIDRSVTAMSTTAHRGRRDARKMTIFFTSYRSEVGHTGRA